MGNSLDPQHESAGRPRWLLAGSVVWGSSLSLPTMGWLYLVGWLLSDEPIANVLSTRTALLLALAVILAATIASAAYFWLVLCLLRHRSTMRCTYALAGVVIPAVPLLLLLLPSVVDTVRLGDCWRLGAWQCVMDSLVWVVQDVPPLIALAGYGWVAGSLLDARYARRDGSPEAAAH